jgi:hypothetical protein
MTGLQTPWLGALWQLGWSREVGSRTPLVVGATICSRSRTASFAACAHRTGSLAGRSFAAGPWASRRLALATWPAIGVAAVASRWPVAPLAAATTIAAVAVASIVAISLGQLLRDCFEGLFALEETEQPRLLGLVLRRRHREDRVTLELHFGVCLQHRARLRARGQQ